MTRSPQNKEECVFRRRLRHYNIAVPFTIRDFNPADFETLWNIDQKCFDPEISYSRAELSFYIGRPQSFTLVAVEFAGPEAAGAEFDGAQAGTSEPSRSRDSSSIAGFIVAEANRRFGHVITIDVLAEARRFGVGSLLLGGVEAHLRQTGCDFVELETAVDNVAALSFYKRHDYNVIRTFPRYYSNGVDALVLQKKLAA